MSVTLVYCTACDWQDEATDLRRDIWERYRCPECGSMAVRWVKYEPHERAQASFVARRQVP
jgi:hypothetical protein